MGSEKTSHRTAEKMDHPGPVIGSQWSASRDEPTSDQRPGTNHQQPDGQQQRRRGRAIATIRDRLFMVNTGLFILVGLVILVRSAFIGLSLLAFIIGGGFVGFGVYRLTVVWKHFTWTRSR
jgi:hypothetical protein